jgi:hypothetical protein
MQSRKMVGRNKLSTTYVEIVVTLERGSFWALISDFSKQI